MSVTFTDRHPSCLCVCSKQPLDMKQGRQGNKRFRLKTETLNSGRLDSYGPKPKQMHIDSYLSTISILTASNWSSAGCILSWCHHVENASDAKLAFRLPGLFSFEGAASYSESCQLSICVWEPLLETTPAVCGGLEGMKEVSLSIRIIRTSAKSCNLCFPLFLPALFPLS